MGMIGNDKKVIKRNENTMKEITWKRKWRRIEMNREETRKGEKTDEIDLDQEIDTIDLETETNLEKDLDLEIDEIGLETETDLEKGLDPGIDVDIEKDQGPEIGKIEGDLGPAHKLRHRRF